MASPLEQERVSIEKLAGGLLDPVLLSLANRNKGEDNIAGKT
jgi:hypothetical protein